MVRDTACRSVLITVGFLLGLTALGCTQSGTRRQQDSRGITVVPSMPLVSAVERRVALVIGNDRYQHVTQLERAVSDAQAIGVALRQLGFEVFARINLDREGMIEAIGALVDRIARGGVGVLFFAGHGVQLGGENFLLPIDVKVARVDDLPDKAIALGRVMERLAQAQAQFTLLILDACRDNPFPKVAGRTIGSTRGLTIPAAPNGLMVIYSAGINEQALDRLSPSDTDPNGLFTREFLKYLPQPGLRVDDMLKRVRGAVRTQATAIGHAQNPAIYDQSSGDFYLVIEDTGAPPDTPVPRPATVPTVPVPPPPSPALSNTSYNSGVSNMRGGRYDRAINDFSQVIMGSPNHMQVANAYYNRGLSYMHTGQKDKAIDDFKKVLELSDNTTLRQRAEYNLNRLVR